jgi:hypothetical protein
MSSSVHGIPTSEPEITNVSTHGFWLLSQGREHFLSFEDFPWFKNASIALLTQVEEVSPGHFYWSELDIDLGLNTIENPEQYPLSSSAQGK